MPHWGRPAKRQEFPQSPCRGPIRSARVSVLWGDHLGKINRNVYGHFTEHLGGCIYDAMWVGEGSSIPNDGGVRKDTAEALKRIQAPMIRWPGGCFADQYHWRDGIGPRATRPRTWNIWWGRDESNQFGTDEFMMYCTMSGAEPYLCFNVGSGTPAEALDWLEYCKGKENTKLTSMRAANGHADPYNVRYWSIGNENWGCGGNFDAEDYAREYARYVTFLNRFAEGGNVEFVACGLFLGDWNQKFFETMLRRPFARGRIQGVNHLSVPHYYFGCGDATKFTDEEYFWAFASIRILERFLQETRAIIEHYTSGKDRIGIALDEWGIWHPVPETGDTGLLQPNTLRDALLACATFNMMHGFGDAISMANIAQTFNVLQALAFTKGPKMALTPTYHAFDLFQPHMDAMALKTLVESPTFKGQIPAGIPFSQQQFVLTTTGGRREMPSEYLSASASLNEGKKQVCVTLVNIHLTEPIEVEVDLAGPDSPAVRGGTIRALTSASVHDENTLDKPEVIRATAPKPLLASGNKFVHAVPAHTAQALVLDLE
ncbi:MAG: alpha-N-arabinofuranosidase [Acidobacteria bacterium]|nr:alpha-N-arabinofuranosidase [Acidobacteriota bacterium]